MSVGSVRASALVLAAPDDNIPPGQGPEWGKAAPIGLLIILLLGLALFFLIKNMNKQFRKVPASFDPPETEGSEMDGDDDGDPPGGTDADADEGTPGVGTAATDPAGAEAEDDVDTKVPIATTPVPPPAGRRAGD